MMNVGFDSDRILFVFEISEIKYNKIDLTLCVLNSRNLVFFTNLESTEMLPVHFHFHQEKSNVWTCNLNNATKHPNRSKKNDQNVPIP